MNKKQRKRYILSILLIFLILIVLYVIAFLIFLLPELMTDEAIPESVQTNFEIYWRIADFPLYFIRRFIPSGIKGGYSDLVLTILNLIIQSHIVYGLIKGVKQFLKRNKSDDAKNGVA